MAALFPIIVFAWAMVGIIVLLKMEKDARKLTWKELKAEMNQPNSANRTIFFQRSSGIMAMVFLWPGILVFRKSILKRFNE